MAYTPKRMLMAAVVVVVLVVAAGLLASWFGWLRPVKGLVISITKPVLYVGQSVGSGVADRWHTLLSIGSLRKDNLLLTEENQALRVTVSALKEAAKENELLREQLDFSKKESYKTELAMIIGHDPGQFGIAVLINRGTDKGIQAGDTVVTSGGALVGKVVEAFNGAAKVRLLLDEASSVSAVAQDSRATGIAHGQLGLSLVMDTIPLDATISEGETVVTSGLAGSYEKGILIGTVERFQNSNSDLFKEARITPAASFNTLETVFVIIEKGL